MAPVVALHERATCALAATACNPTGAEGTWGGSPPPFPLFELLDDRPAQLARHTSETRAKTAARCSLNSQRSNLEFGLRAAGICGQGTGVFRTRLAVLKDRKSYVGLEFYFFTGG